MYWVTVEQTIYFDAETRKWMEREIIKRWVVSGTDAKVESQEIIEHEINVVET